MLRYYGKESEYKAGKPPRGILNFQQVNFVFASSDATEPDPKQRGWFSKTTSVLFSLKPQGCDRVFNLRCAKNEAEPWKLAIESSLANSIGRKRLLDISWYEQSLQKSFRFWAFRRVSEQ